MEAGEHADEPPGDPACWSHLVCPECGAFTGDGYHRDGCSHAGEPVGRREGGNR